MKDNKWIWLDCDGTIADLYSVKDWLPKLRAEDPSPYAQAAPLVNMNTLARKLNKLQRKGWKIGIISWLSKNSTTSYDKAVTAAKLWWLKKHLTSVHFDEINIVSYGVNKWEICGKGILFDDESRNRNNWQGEAFHPDMMMEILNKLMKGDYN